MKNAYFTILIFLSFGLTAIAQPANDDCASATTLAVGGTCTTVTINNTGATDSGISTSCGGAVSATDIWYSITVPATGGVRVTTSQSTGGGTQLTDTVLELWNACSGTSLGCNDDFVTFYSELSIPATAGSTVLVQVGGFNGGTGEFDICATEYTPPIPPVNNDCAMPTDLPVTPEGGTCTPIDGSVVLSSNSGIDHTCAWNVGGSDVWYRITVPTSGSFTVETMAPSSGTNLDTAIEVYDDCMGTTSYGCDDDQGLGTFSLVEVTGMTPGAFAYVAVYQFGGSNVTDNTYSICAREVASLLPIELKEFKGQSLSKGNLLSWVTASENNNSHFEVEQSANGIDFTSIGRVEGAANSEVILAYSLMDQNPLLQTYYRLKQVDLDGTSTYSEIIVIEREEAIDPVSVFPNPSTGVFNLKFIPSNDKEVYLTVVDIQGKLVWQENYELSLNEYERQINISDLPGGVYFLNIMNGEKIVQEKIVITKLF